MEFSLNFDKLLEENCHLQEIVEKLLQERNQAQSKALINHQIAEESQMNAVEIIAEFEEKINELRRIIQDKEISIQNLEKSSSIPEGDGVVIKYKEVIAQNEQKLRLTNENELLAANLKAMRKDIMGFQTINEAIKEEKEVQTSFHYRICILNS